MKCSFCDRDESTCKIKTISGLNYCPKHLTRHYRHQNMDNRSIYDANEYVVYEDHAEIILCSVNGNEVARAIIDLNDVERCKQHKWHLRKGHGDTDYVIASLPNNQKIHLHRFIMEYCGSDDVDHINRNGLDNRKCNLRIVNHSENAANNKHDGIYRVKSGRYRATCCINYKSYYIGTFDTYEEAVQARAAYLDNAR